MLIGYARISTTEQNLALQTDALTQAGCDKIFTDTVCGAKTERPGLNEAMTFTREGDTLVVWRLDRLGRSLKHLIETVNLMEQRKIAFRSLKENIDTSTPTGKLFFHIFGALAEFERELIRERTNAGLQAARARGRKGGRKPALDIKQIKMLQSLHADPNNAVTDICQTLNISQATFYRYLKPEAKE